MKSVDKSKLINATQAGALYGKSSARVGQIALELKAKGYEWPKKVGRQWLAPVSEWEKILDPKKRETNETKTTLKTEVITAAEAGRRLNITSNWLITLGKRSLANGASWPIKQGHNWIAPFQEWKEIASDPGLRLLKMRRENK